MQRMFIQLYINHNYTPAPKPAIQSLQSLTVIRTVDRKP